MNHSLPSFRSDPSFKFARLMPQLHGNPFSSCQAIFGGARCLSDDPNFRIHPFDTFRRVGGRSRKKRCIIGLLSVRAVRRPRYCTMERGLVPPHLLWSSKDPESTKTLKTPLRSPEVDADRPAPRTLVPRFFFPPGWPLLSMARAVAHVVELAR